MHVIGTSHVRESLGCPDIVNYKILGSIGMVKITASKDKSVKGKTYYKYRMAISKEIMQNLGWDENTHVTRKVVGKKLIIEKE